jgi:hypothetical protein
VPPQRGWWSRNWKWALPVGCLLPLVLCGGGLALFATVIYGAVTGAIRSSDAYQVGMAQARSNRQVVGALGEPIESGFWISGSINVEARPATSTSRSRSPAPEGPERCTSSAPGAPAAGSTRPWPSRSPAGPAGSTSAPAPPDRQARPADVPDLIEPRLP